MMLGVYIRYRLRIHSFSVKIILSHSTTIDVELEGKRKAAVSTSKNIVINL